MRLRAAASKMVDDRGNNTASRREHGRAHGELEIEAVTQGTSVRTSTVNSLNTFAVALDEPPGREVAGVR